MAIEWDIEPGTKIRRSELHDIYGGGRRGGMEPSAKSPNVILITSPTAGELYGYSFDGWHPDGTFHYTGEGQVSDQVMTHGNRAVRDHIAQGRALRLFEKSGTDVIYVGEFELPNESHILIDEAPDINKEDLRSVFVFRLRPVGETWTDAELNAPEKVLPLTLPLEASNVTEYIKQRVGTGSTIALRTEAELVGRYVKWLAATSGETVERQAIPTSGGHLMYTDIFVRESLDLIEAKSSSSRHHIRLALGQILDYARYVTHAKLAVLTPTRPAGELIALLVGHGVGSIWETEQKGKFESSRVPDQWSA